MPDTTLDHLVYATPDLESSIEHLTQRLGVCPVRGGRHPGRGTRNALLALGPRSYLELIGPDPDQGPPRWFTLDELREPRVVGWAVSDERLEELSAAAGGVLGPISSGSRTRPDGETLRWRFTDPAVRAMDGLVPFFIDWLGGPHPADGLPQALRLVELRLFHPDAAAVEAMLRKLGLAIEVRPGPLARISALLSTPNGDVAL